jgi:hypothetical protein
MKIHSVSLPRENVGKVTVHSPKMATHLYILRVILYLSCVGDPLKSTGTIL